MLHALRYKSHTNHSPFPWFRCCLNHGHIFRTRSLSFLTNKLHKRNQQFKMEYNLEIAAQEFSWNILILVHISQISMTTKMIIDQGDSYDLHSALSNFSPTLFLNWSLNFIFCLFVYFCKVKVRKITPLLKNRQVF